MARSRESRAKLSRAERNIRWIERNCRIPEGKDVGKRVVLREWQKSFLREIYDNPAGTRRAIFSVGRKNAKTTLVAFLLLLHLVGDEGMERKNSQLYSAAQSKEQAGVIFDLAAKIVRMSPELFPFVTIRDTVKQMLCPEHGTKYRALSAEVSTSYGLSPAFIVHDELGQVRGPKSEHYEALETATAAQDSPLSIIISTQAPTDGDLLSILVDDALAGHDPRTVVRIYSASKDADPFEDDTIRQANPAFGDFQNADEVRAMAEDARRMPSRESQYRNLVLNQRVEASSPFISRTLWGACSAEVAESWGTRPVFGGLDLSSTTDLTALALVCEVDGVVQVRPTFWLPEEGLAERSRLDRVPYDVWHEQGYLQVTPGRTVDYEFVARYLIDEVFSSMKVRRIAFDRWAFNHLRQVLSRAGVTDKLIDETFVEFGQGFQSMSPALHGLETLVLSQRLAHGGHPVLNMCAWNSVVTKDPAGNRKLNKAKSRGRIDGMVALAMATAVRATTVEVKKNFRMAFV